MSETVSARRTGRSARKPRTYAEGRVCSHDGCNTRLSTYNPRPTCRSHTPLRFPRVRGRVDPRRADG